MKKLIVLLGVVAFMSCSKDDPCEYSRAELDNIYLPILESEDATDQQKKEALAEYKARMEKAC